MARITILAAALPLLLAACGDTGVGQNAPGQAPIAESTPPPSPTPSPGAQESESAPATTPPSGPSTTAQEPAPQLATAANGESVYRQRCATCHAAAVAGAPKLGDKADWAPRIAQGSATLYGHAINGFKGKKGVMPPRGGASSLSDEQVKAAVDYMVSQAS